MENNICLTEEEINEKISELKEKFLNKKVEYAKIINSVNSNKKNKNRKLNKLQKNSRKKNR